MVYNKRQSGFSLMEVLFAVMVLTMGLVFVASMFPIGLANSHKVIEATLAPINAHNAEVMIDLQLRNINPSLFNNAPPALMITDGNVHLLVKPNLLVENFINGRLEMILDDPENLLNLGDPQVYTLGFLAPFLTSYDNGSDIVLRPRNLGKIVSPPVDKSDREVQIILGPDYAEDDDASIMGNAIYDVALERKFSWCALYRYNQWTNTFRFYVFNMNRVSHARYAVQDTDHLDAPVGLDVAQDRAFPVPWQVELDTEIDILNDPVYQLPGALIDRFVLNAYTATDDNADAIANILRPGSVIVDRDSGYVNEILDIELIGKLNEEHSWLVKLRNNLDIIPLQSFWVVPPAIVGRPGAGLEVFADKQPVVNVIQKIIQF